MLDLKGFTLLMWLGIILLTPITIISLITPANGELFILTYLGWLAIGGLMGWGWKRFQDQLPVNHEPKDI